MPSPYATKSTRRSLPVRRAAAAAAVAATEALGQTPDPQLVEFARGHRRDLR